MGCKYFSSAGMLLSILLMVLPGSVITEGSSCSYVNLSLIESGNLFPLMAVGFALFSVIFLWLRQYYGQMSPICLGLSLVSQILSWVLFHTVGLIGFTAALLQLSVLFQKYLPKQKESDS